MINQLGSKIVTITPVMKEILEFCRTSHTLNEIVQWVCISRGCSYSSIYPAIAGFLKRMVKLGVLVRNEDHLKEPTQVLEKIKQGKRIGNFTLLEEIARNSKAILYKCTLPGDSQTFYTIKIQTPSGSRRSFMREFRILNALPHHANIRKVITADDLIYLGRCPKL